MFIPFGLDIRTKPFRPYTRDNRRNPLKVTAVDSPGVRLTVPDSVWGDGSNPQSSPRRVNDFAITVLRDVTDVNGRRED